MLIISFGSETGIQSPDSITSRIESNSSSFVSFFKTVNICINDGTEFHTDTLYFVIIFFQWAGFVYLSTDGTTTVPPTESSPNISYTDKSKLSCAMFNTTSFSVTLYLIFISSIVLTAALCEMATPFGFPVEPDVYMIYAREFSSATGNSFVFTGAS